MLFMITQTHTPESCPMGAGGADALINKSAAGVKVKGRRGAWTHHTIWYLVDARSTDALQEFLEPGMKRCTCAVVPVAEEPLKRA